MKNSILVLISLIISLFILFFFGLLTALKSGYNPLLSSIGLAILIIVMVILLAIAHVLIEISRLKNHSILPPHLTLS